LCYYLTLSSSLALSSLSLHDALPILVWLNSYTNSSCGSRTIWEGSLNYTSTLTSRVSIRLSYPLMLGSFWGTSWFAIWSLGNNRSEEHTSELQSRFDLVCRLLLEKNK